MLNRYMLLLSLGYFILRISFLTRLPVFNDEAIYLDWGWRETHAPGYLFYSLYDAKQPLLMWLFGIFQIFFTDPLFAGRMVSVITGFLSMIGLYFLGKEILNKQIGLLAGFLYIVTPIFSFFDRQALMESSIAAVGVWTCYFLIRFLKTFEKKYAIYIGLILGMGFFIKSTALIFVISYFIVLLYCYFSTPLRRYAILKNIFLSAAAFFCVDLLLFLQPKFWQTFFSNSRYSYSLSDVIGLPIAAWMKNFLGNAEIMFFYLTPFFFVSGLVGLFLLLRQKNKNLYILILFFITSLVLQTSFTRFVSQRYLVAFLPLLLLPSSYVLWKIYVKHLIGNIVVIGGILLAAGITLVQVIYPIEYFRIFSAVSSYSEGQYISGFTSGYGVNEAVMYLRQVSEGSTIFVGIAQNSGNPESAILVYFHKDNNIRATYFAAELVPSIHEYNCIQTGLPTYFVSRDEQRAGLEKFLTLKKSIKNPYGKNRIGIYMLNQDCKGKILKLEVVKT